MIDTSGAVKRSLRPLATIVGLALIIAAQVQAQQPTYPGPGQSYPSSPPAYPAPSYPAPNPTYPNPAYPNPAYPNPAYPGAAPPYPGHPGAAPPLPQPSHFFRDLFAQTLAVVLQSSTGGLLGTIAGRIMEWFTRKGYNPAAVPNGAQYPQYPNAGYPPGAAYGSAVPGYPNPNPSAVYSAGTPGAYPVAPQAYPQAPAYPSPNAYPPPAPQAYPTQPGASTPAAYGTPPGSAPAAYGATPGSAPPAYGTTPGSAPAAYGTTPGSAPPAYGAAPGSAPAYGTAAPQVYDATTGQLLSAAANPYATRGLDMQNAIYAGIAYEVQIIGADGQTTPVNTATYEFHTGDKFNLVYRPSLPGHMQIFNINAAGQRTLIDSSEMAAGQMTKLGPYQFSNQSGDESLRLVLTPCTNPQLQATTRDIVKLGATPSVTNGRTLKLPDCDAPVARGLEVHTRDIQKVGVEETTSFALDPISPKEMISGQVAPREAIVVFHHR